MSDRIYYTKYKSPFCEIILVGNEDGLTNLHLDTKQGKREFTIDESWIKNDDIFVEIKRQLDEYFDGKRKSFDVKLNLKGTDFQKKVWNELAKIPYGQTYTYGDVAKKIGNKNASRAIGMANSKNPIPLIIPCHRVVGSNGKLTGFAHGLDIKEKLINHEK